MATIGEILVSIGLDTDELTKGLGKAEKGLDRFGSKASKIGKDLSLSITAPLTAAAAGVIKLASDLEETNAKFETTFKGVQKEASETAKVLQRDYGLSIRASKNLLASTGDLLNGFGFTKNASLELSSQIQQLAVDLTSFNDFAGGAAGASEILTKALLGERDALLQLNTKISETDVKNKLLEKGQKDLTGQALLQAKALATLELIQQQSTNAIGDFARTSGSFANQLRTLKADLENLGAEIGTGLLPLATKLVGFVKDAVNSFRALSLEQKTLALEIAAGAAALGPFTFLMGKVIELSAGFIGAVKNMTKAIKGFNTALLKTVGRVSLVVGAIGGMLLLGKSIYDTYEPLRDFFKNLWDGIVTLFTSAVQVLKDTLGPLFEIFGIKLDEVLEGMGKSWNSFLEDFTNGAEKLGLDQVWVNLKQNFNDLVAFIGQGAEGLVKPIKDALSTLDGAFTGLAGGMGGEAQGDFQRRAVVQPLFKSGEIQSPEVVTQLSDEFKQAKLANDNLIDSMKESNKLAEQFGQIAGNAFQSLIEGGEGFSDVLKNLIESAISLVTQLAIASAFTGGPLGGGFFGGLFSSLTPFASGGIVSGPTPALVGEYPGAKTNPEVIAPLSDLKQMLSPMINQTNQGGQNIEVSGEFVVRGEDLVYLLRRTLRNELQTLGENNLQGGNVQL